MSRWRAGAVGLALGMCTALGCGAVDESREPVQDEAPVPQVRQEPDAPIPPPPEQLPSAPLWTVQSSLPELQDVAGLDSDGAGGFIVLARTQFVGDSGWTGLGNLVLTRHDAMGMQRWSLTLDVTPGPAGMNVPQSSALAVSSSGDSFVSLQVLGGGTLLLGDASRTGGCFLVKLGPDGTVRWVRIAQADALAADAEGGVVAVTRQGTVARYDAEGVLQWTWTPPARDSLVFTTVAVDAEGNVVAAGNQLVDLSNGAGFILGLSPSGEQRWLRTTPDAAGWANFSDLALLPEGGMLLTGMFKQSFLWGNDRVNQGCGTGAPCFPSPAILAADARGNPRWAMDLDGDSISPRVAVRSDGEALVSWESQCTARLMRLSPAGEVRWRVKESEGPCAQDRLLPRDVAFLRDGTFVSAGLLMGTRTFGEGVRFSADEGDIVLQRMNP
ncbi:hypothetical protein JY651_34590 [Pyxidicoccus parkwayensis]|uniref:Lipoprotein n=1 Tax=Pyxidicoccus parkwayensis TaxID=2813578 RepID=A0ABX7NNB3_9BACT|nr:hypothetical protein [Pyxidicoccus parkwaysis]QSQ20355.1 hypothetical protein JY651_34590 [Pyxidicoccus parkwaysis]